MFLNIPGNGAEAIQLMDKNLSVSHSLYELVLGILAESQRRGFEPGFQPGRQGIGFSAGCTNSNSTLVIELSGRRASSMRRFNEPITFAIEQPELHLHPLFQARLADAFCNIVREARRSKSDLRLVIETHSETMVNRFGH